MGERVTVELDAECWLRRRKEAGIDLSQLFAVWGIADGAFQIDPDAAESEAMARKWYAENKEAIEPLQQVR